MAQPQMNTQLNITVLKAGDPEKLGALLRAAVELQDKVVEQTVPRGYRCVECYCDDGGHEQTCSMSGQPRTLVSNAT